MKHREKAPLTVTPAKATAWLIVSPLVRFISESILRAAEQVREVLYTKAEATSGGTVESSPDRG